MQTGAAMTKVVARSSSAKLVFLGILCLGLFAFTGVAQAQNSGPRIFQVNGDTATLNWYDTSVSDVSVSVYATRNGTASTPETFVYYLRGEIKDWCTSKETSFWGLIDANALTGQGNSSMRLLVDTAKYPQLQRQQCTQDNCYGGVYCEEPSDIVLDLQWKRLGTYQQDSTMKTKITTLTSVWQENLKQSMGNAIASGTVGDMQIRVPDAYLGSTTTSTLQVEKRVH